MSKHIPNGTLDRNELAAANPGGSPGWRRGLLIAAAVLIAGTATVLVLQAAGPEVRALIASEGTLINDPSR